MRKIGVVTVSPHCISLHQMLKRNHDVREDGSKQVISRFFKTNKKTETQCNIFGVKSTVEWKQAARFLKAHDS